MSGSPLTRLVVSENVNILAPGFVFDGCDVREWDVHGWTLILTNQDASSENGIYVWHGGSRELIRVSL
jgi:hypothetical protein